MSRFRRAVHLAALLLVFVLAALWSARPISHDDTFWHIRTGEIVLDEWVVPTTDSFSYTRTGERFVSHEWGFGVLLHIVHEMAGLEGLYGLQILLVLAISASMAGLLRERVRDDPLTHPLIPALLALGLWGAIHELKLNAALVTTLFLVWQLWLIRVSDRTRKRGVLFLFVPLFLFWSNAHSGVVFGLILLLVRVFESGLLRTLPEAWRRGLEPENGHSPAVWSLVTAGCLVIAVANPNGVEAPLYPFRLSWFLFAGDLPLDMGHFAMPTPADRPGFFVLVGGLLTGLVVRRTDARIRLLDVLPAMMFLLLSLRSNRFVFDFAALTLPVLTLLYAPSVGAFSRLVPPVTSAAVLAIAVTAAIERDPDLLAPEFPLHAAAFLEREGIRGNVLNHQNFGGYLGWRLRWPMFWDGRNEVFGPLMKELVGKSFEEITDRFGIEVLVLMEREYQPLASQVSKKEWALVYWDDLCAVLLRRVPKFQEQIERNEFRLFEAFGPFRNPRLLDTEEKRLARDELDRVILANPNTQKALFFRALLELGEGDLAAARRDLEGAARVRSNPAVDRVLLAVIRRALPAD